MSDQPTQDLATRAFQKRVLDEFAALRREMGSEFSAVRAELTTLRQDITEIRSDIVEIRSQQSAIAKNISSLDERLTLLEERVDARLKETRPIWEGVQEQLQRLFEKFDAVILEFYELRGEFKIHGRRIAELERRVPT
jgi:predicted  nucleic acid-binding Zn-ribbon protein